MEQHLKKSNIQKFGTNYFDFKMSLAKFVFMY